MSIKKEKKSLFIQNQKLKKNNSITQIKLALEKDRLLFDEIDCTELRYFAYKSRGISQYTSTKLIKPYQENEHRVRLFESIRYVYGRLHDPSHHLKIVFYKNGHEYLLGWVREQKKAKFYLFINF